MTCTQSLFPYCISASVLLQALWLPLLGGLADYTNLKKRLMAVFCYSGAAATCLLVFITDDRYLAGGVLLIVANVCLGASIVRTTRSSMYGAAINIARRDAARTRCGQGVGVAGTRTE